MRDPFLLTDLTLERTLAQVPELHTLSLEPRVPFEERAE